PRRDVRRRAVRGDRHHVQPARAPGVDRLLQLGQDADALLLQLGDRLRVVDDVAEAGDAAPAVGGGLDDLQRLAHAEAVAQLVGEADLKAAHRPPSLATPGTHALVTVPATVALTGNYSPSRGLSQSFGCESRTEGPSGHRPARREQASYRMERAPRRI